jgi:hypothetical protein
MLALIDFILSIPLTGAVFAQTADQPAQRGDGGLHVSNGGMVGYVGGSGSISGDVVGPGGSSGGSTKPADAEPNAITGGSVAPLEETAQEQRVDTTPARSPNDGAMNLFIGFAVLVGIALLVLSVRRRPRTA